MMGCKNCIITELQYDIKLEGDKNEAMKEAIKSHFTRRNLTIIFNQNTFRISESGMSEFLDFCLDEMEADNVYFKVEDGKWQPITEARTVVALDWIDEVIRNKQVICYSQPIVDAQQRIFGYEVLARFRNADGTMLYPNEVFHAAKLRGRLYALDRLCRLTAVRYAAVLQKRTFINFIPTSIYAPKFCLQSTVTLAKQLNIDPKQFVFEVVESEYVEDIEHLKNILKYYHEKGFAYALDDVGEGFSTIDLLVELKPNYMKLDKKYVQGVSNDIVKQRVAIKFFLKACEIGAVPLAEGIEEYADFLWLKKIGYELFQGYYFAKPTEEPTRFIDVVEKPLFL